jgi:glutathione peroxidase
MRKIIIIGSSVLVLLSGFVIYHSKKEHMTIRQYMMKWVYPLFSALMQKKALRLSNETAIPPVNFYSLKAVKNDGTLFSFDSLRGKTVLLVNTASDCGYTPQYAELQQLHKQYGDKLTILAFPSNDFKNQEKRSDAAIAQFCRKSYGVTFPIMKKISVLKGEHQDPVYRWLTDPKQNGWNGKAPSWNFGKYIISREGRLIHYLDPALNPQKIIGLVNTLQNSKRD